MKWSIKINNQVISEKIGKRDSKKIRNKKLEQTKLMRNYDEKTTKKNTECLVNYMKNVLATAKEVGTEQSKNIEQTSRRIHKLLTKIILRKIRKDFENKQKQKDKKLEARRILDEHQKESILKRKI